MKFKNPTPGVATLIYNPEGHILLIKRNQGNGIGLWSPPGGFIEYNEHFFDTAKRETLEEVGLKIEQPKLFSVTDEQHENGNHHITIWIKPTKFTGNIKPEPNEVSDFFWCDVENLPKDLFLPFKHLLETDEWKNK